MKKKVLREKLKAERIMKEIVEKEVKEISKTRGRKKKDDLL